MPLPLAALIPAAIAAGTSIFQGVANNRAAKRANRESQAYNDRMYAQQRADNEKQWHLQNDYNSPTSQMSRLRESGLNPNLVYGKGADNISAPIPSTTAGSWTPNVPQTDLSGIGSALDNYYNYQIKDAQLDNLKTQNTVSTQEAALKAAQVANTTAGTAKTRFELEMASELKQNSMDYARENLRKLSADADFQISENERRNIQTSNSLKESAERILTMREQRATSVADRARIRAQIQNIKNSSELQQLDIELKQNGIQTSDPIYMRVLGRALGAGNISIKDSWEKTNPIPEIKDTFNKIFKRSNWLPKKR